MDRTTSSGRRLAQSESVSFMEALRHHTAGGPYAAFDEDDLGTLEPGKCADFVIWQGDLEKVGTGSDAVALKPEATYLAGKAVYKSA
jgi:predicted amidohydrolase YtcJ